MTALKVLAGLQGAVLTIALLFPATGHSLLNRVLIISALAALLWFSGRLLREEQQDNRI